MCVSCESFWMLECKSREMLDAKFVGLTCGSRPNAEIKCVHSAEQRWVLYSRGNVLGSLYDCRFF